MKDTACDIWKIQTKVIIFECPHCNKENKIYQTHFSRFSNLETGIRKGNNNVIMCNYCANEVKLKNKNDTNTTTR